MKNKLKPVLILLILLFLIGCTTTGAMVQRAQLDACNNANLDTLVFKDQYGVTYAIICTVPDSEADHVVEIEIISEIVEMVK